MIPISSQGRKQHVKGVNSGASEVKRMNALEKVVSVSHCEGLTSARILRVPQKKEG